MDRSFRLVENLLRGTSQDNRARLTLCDTYDPRNREPGDSGFNAPENLISLSSPIITSSMRSHLPRRTLLGVSNVETMSPPE